MDSPRLLLIDALGIAYRSFFAIRGLSTSCGRPTNALFGFIKTVSQLERLWTPTHALVVFDGGLPRERLELLHTYKAQRPTMPPDLKSQLPAMEDWLDAASIARSRIEGEEADDVIASSALRAAGAGVEALIATSDKDLMQIVGAGIFLVAPGKAEEKIGPEEVYAKIGVRPEQVADFLALTGDSSDNIPGVPGIGARTAAKLLGQWGSAANILSNVQAVAPEKIRQSLFENGETVSRNLAMLRLRIGMAPIPSLDEIRVRPPNGARLLAFYEKMEFRTLAESLRNPTLF